MRSNYRDFIDGKQKQKKEPGITPSFLPDYLKGFQSHLCEWSLQTGKSALLADCGLGKGVMALVWGENVLKKGKKGRILIAAPLAVARQFEREGAKFDIKVNVSQDGSAKKGINVTNYERLKNFNPEDFDGVVCDESSILKNFDGKLRRSITDFMQVAPYRLLCSATPAPNDFMELGSSSEALGNMSRNQMLGMFFTNDGESTQQWRLKGHAKTRFWQWVSTWARAVRKPSDLGFDDEGYDLPELIVHKHTIAGRGPKRGFLPNYAKTLEEIRHELKRTVGQRCQLAADCVPKDRPCIVWCHRIDESKLLTKLIPGAVEVEGADKDEVKEKRLIGFTQGDTRVLVTKPKIAGFGLNWQHCSDVVYFPTFSQESYYQAIRRCWRFGQVNPVNVHLVSTERLKRMTDSMIRKERQSDELFDGIVRNMMGAIGQKTKEDKERMELPLWL